MNIEQQASVSSISVTINPMDEIKKTVDRLNSIIEEMIENTVEKCCADCSC